MCFVGLVDKYAASTISKRSMLFATKAADPSIFQETEACTRGSACWQNALSAVDRTWMNVLTMANEDCTSETMRQKQSSRPMSAPYAAIAMSAAQSLASLDPSPPSLVGSELDRSSGQTLGARSLDPVSLAALVVNVASVGWTVYDDLKKDGRKPDRSAVVLRIREGAAELVGASDVEGARVIEAVVAQLDRDG